MSNSPETNSTELNDQVADLQIKAFLTVIVEIGEVLEKSATLAPIDQPAAASTVDQKATGRIKNPVTCITDGNSVGQILARARRRSESASGRNQRGETSIR